MRLVLFFGFVCIQLLRVKSTLSHSSKHNVPGKCKSANCKRVPNVKNTTKISLPHTNNSTKATLFHHVNKSLLLHPKNTSQKCKNCTTSKRVRILPNNKKSKKDIVQTKHQQRNNANHLNPVKVARTRKSHPEKINKYLVMPLRKQLMPPKKSSGCTKSNRLHRCGGKRRKGIVPVTRNASKRSDQPELSVDENDVVKKISKDIEKIRFLTDRKKSSNTTTQIKDLIGNHTYNRLNKYVDDAKNIKDNVDKLKNDVLSDIPPAISQATVSSLIMTSMNPMHVIRKAFSKLAANALPRTLHMIGAVARILKNISEQEPEDILREAHLLDGKSKVESRKTNATTFIESVNYRNDTATHVRMIRGI